VWSTVLLRWWATWLHNERHQPENFGDWVSHVDVRSVFIFHSVCSFCTYLCNGWLSLIWKKEMVALSCHFWFWSKWSSCYFTKLQQLISKYLLMRWMISPISAKQEGIGSSSFNITNHEKIASKNISWVDNSPHTQLNKHWILSVPQYKCFHSSASYDHLMSWGVYTNYSTCSLSCWTWNSTYTERKPWSGPNLKRIWLIIQLYSSIKPITIV